MMKNRIAVVMGSQTDWDVMSRAVETLQHFGVDTHVQVLSAHRMPDELMEFAATAEDSGFAAIVAGAGGAAHLPGMLAAKTLVPVLGVPIPTAHLAGHDSLYSIVQMPAGTPVATFSIGHAGATNAALFAVSLLAAHNDNLHQALVQYRAQRHDEASHTQLPTS
jgi:5-(carboxyamino)imidazole ribonucleotide mutase